MKTIMLLAGMRPGLVFVQNPSMIAASVVCALRAVIGYRVVVDRHSNFKFETLQSKELKYKAFHLLSRYTIRNADLTIVTNSHLQAIVQEWGGRGVVLQDKLPDLPLKQRKSLAGVRNVVFISSFADDEPIREVVESARMIDKSVHVYITGNYKKTGVELPGNLPENVSLSGYLPEDEFQSLIYSADALLALTTADFTLLCGAYEGVALHKPLIISDKDALKGYFSRGVVVTRNEPEQIAKAIQTALDRIEELQGEMKEFAAEVNQAWFARFERFKSLVQALEEGKSAI